MGLEYLKGGDLRYHLTLNKTFTEEQTSNYYFLHTKNLKYILINFIKNFLLLIYLLDWNQFILTEFYIET